MAKNDDSEIPKIPDSLQEFKNQLLSYIPNTDEEKDLLEIIKQNSSIYQHEILMRGFYKNVNLMRKAVIYAPWLMKDLLFDRFEPDYEFDYETAVMAAAVDGQVFYYLNVCEPIFGNTTLRARYIWDVLKLNPAIIQHLNPNEPNYRQYAASALERNGRLLVYVKSADLKDDLEFLKPIIDNSPSAYKYISDRLKNRIELALEIVRSNGLLLKYVPQKLKEENKALLLTAVNNNGKALHLIPERWRDDKEIIMASIKQNPEARHYLKKNIRRKYRIEHIISGMLFTRLTESEFKFIGKGEKTIEQIYEKVKKEYPVLCLDDFMCSENCKNGTNQPEWKHKVIDALKYTEINGFSVKKEGDNLWLFSQK